MSMTNEEKKALVKKIFNELINHYELQDVDGLCRFIGVKYATLKGWERRGNIADVEPFLFRCHGINVGWLKTGTGNMFLSPSPAISEKQLLFTPEARSVVGEQFNDYATPYIGKIVRLLQGMDEDTQKDICLMIEKEKLLRDLLQQQKAG